MADAPLVPGYFASTEATATALLQLQFGLLDWLVKSGRLSLEEFESVAAGAVERCSEFAPAEFAETATRIIETFRVSLAASNTD